MSQEATPRTPSTALCERHGLRFDPAQHDGCVLCRRERQGTAAAPPSAGAESPAGRAWAVAALIWILAGGALYVAHREVLASFALFTAGAEAAFGGDEDDAEAWSEPRSAEDGTRDPLADAEAIETIPEEDDPDFAGEEPFADGDDSYADDSDF